MEPIWLKVTDNSWTEVTRERNPNSRWDADDDYTSHNFTGLTIAGDHGDVPVNFPVAIDDVLFVICAIYDSGNSFGTQRGAYTEFVSAHKDMKIAKENLNRLEDWAKAIEAGQNKWSNGGFRVKIVQDDGTEMDYMPPWGSMFSGLESLEIEALIVKEKIT
jgi:hypothetical protein